MPNGSPGRLPRSHRRTQLPDARHGGSSATRADARAPSPSDRYPAASSITLQARLRRTKSDLAPILHLPTAVRLVKGAFPLGEEHDHQGRSAIRQSFLALAEQMLAPATREAGFYPSFATHDDAIIDRVIVLAQAHGWKPEEYEVECLYGVRTRWQLELRRHGFNVRVYLPFGTDWWPYVLRRVGENPSNLLRVARVALR